MMLAVITIVPFSCLFKVFENKLFVVLLEVIKEMLIPWFIFTVYAEESLRLQIICPDLKQVNSDP